MSQQHITPHGAEDRQLASRAGDEAVLLGDGVVSQPISVSRGDS
jgi:hypothetical protein